jgi:hypothetical protein
MGQEIAKTTMYSQRDDRWRRLRLGSSGVTIGDYGCLLCAVASGVTDLGVRIHSLVPDPPRLNRWLARNEGFIGSDPASRNRFVFNAMAPLGVEMVDYIDCRNSPAPLGPLEAALAREDQFAVIQVDFAPATGGTQQHWVRPLAWFETDVQIMDPWLEGPSQQAFLMTHYAQPDWDDPRRAIFRIVVYRVRAEEADYGTRYQAPVIQDALCPHPDGVD